LDKLTNQHDSLNKELDGALKLVHKETKQNKEDINELLERIKYNYDRLDNLTELPLRVEVKLY